MKFILIILLIFIFNNILIMFYCIFSKWHDRNYFEKIKNIKIDSTNITEINDKKSFFSKIYEVVNSYFCGWIRLNVIYVGKIPSFHIRKMFYKFIFRMNVSKKTVIYGGCEFRSPWNIVIGNAVIANNCIFDGRRGITIGDNVVFGGNVRIWTEEHNINDPWFRVLPQNAGSVSIKEHSWICSDSTILPGVCIEKGAVVASRACVTKDCKEYTVYGGVPAKRISDREINLKYELSGKPTYHFY